MAEDFVAKKPLRWELKRHSFCLELTERFDLNSIKLICSALNLKFEELGGEKLSEKTFALVDYCEINDRLFDLITVCQQMRPQRNWWLFLEPWEQQTGKKRVFNSVPQKSGLSYWIALFLAIILLSIGLAIGYFVNLNISKFSSSPFARSGFAFGADIDSADTTYDFEECSESLSQWQLVYNDLGELDCSTDYAYKGLRSLTIPVNIREREDIESPAGTTQIWLQNQTLVDKLVVIRVFTPPESPPTMAAHLLVLDTDNRPHFGPLTQLRPGSWNGMVWVISDYEELDDIKTLAIEFKIEGQNLPAENSQYQGRVYIDFVEIYPLSRSLGTIPQLDNFLSLLIDNNQHNSS